MTTFVTLCETYMGIELDFNLRNNFFNSWLQQGSSMETMALGNVEGVVGCERVRPSRAHVVAPVESQMLVEPTSEAQEEQAPVMPGADGALQGVASVEVDGAST
jgi:hypothetical protein